MINIEKQIEYWKHSALTDLETAEILINNSKTLQGLFFCHLSVEKILKAHIVKVTSLVPPRSHDLFYLVSTAGIEISEDQMRFMQILMKYQLEGRYPEYAPALPSTQNILLYFNKTKELYEWFKDKL
jgi:HEPN domain-containing protein